MMLTRENILEKFISENDNKFSFEELTNIPKINLRGNSSDRVFVTSVGNILETFVPTEPNTINYNNKLKIIWLSPNEWLIEIYEIENFKKIFLNLKNSLNTQNTAITDITNSRTIIKLSGTHIYKILAKFMIIDLHKALIKNYSVAQTIFIKLPVLIIRNHNENEKESILLHVNRSHAPYIINLLIDGSKNIDF